MSTEDPEPPAAQTPNGDGGADRPFYKRPIWIIVGVFVLLGAFGAFVEEDDEDAEQTAAEAEDDTATPTPTPSPTPTPTPTPTPVPEEPEPLDEDEQREIFAASFEADRDTFADTLEETIDVETVDLIAFSDGTVQLGVTSTWAADDNIREGAWGTAREMAFLWSDDYWPNDPREPEWWPDLSMSVSQFSYECAGETMRNLAERRLDRSGWEAAC